MLINGIVYRSRHSVTASSAVNHRFQFFFGAIHEIKRRSLKQSPLLKAVI
ncbi:hypothetical protein VCHC17A1_2166 [Vibrio cholerae HC-17A1]|uniref:Uncharacterized protein n=1 Tax=Vibrio cholerae (strain MO10) TaxID=345072 RepID=A0A0X1KY21_VIBCO|nr:conserved hypothetical protein [Vibrio cholerae MO10]EKK97076.1 hypothetical protein VCHC17A1_2166 [Vibrio cholerae HC-17A1]